MLDSDNFCICSHPMYEHVGYSFNAKSPVACSGYSVSHEWCRCAKFKLDNLRYLEKAYEQSL
jgi:hypothetical protein